MSWKDDVLGILESLMAQKGTSRELKELAGVLRLSERRRLSLRHVEPWRFLLKKTRPRYMDCKALRSGNSAESQDVFVGPGGYWRALLRVPGAQSQGAC